MSTLHNKLSLSFSNSSSKEIKYDDIKEEPLDVAECTVDNLDIKEELEDLGVWAPTEHESPANISITEEERCDCITTTSSAIKKVITNGQLTPSVLKAQVTTNGIPDPNTPSPVVKNCKNLSLIKITENSLVMCKRCYQKFRSHYFRQHIDTCPARTSDNKLSSQINNSTIPETNHCEIKDEFSPSEIMIKNEPNNDDFSSLSLIQSVILLPNYLKISTGNFKCMECNFRANTLGYMQLHIGEKHLGVSMRPVYIKNIKTRKISPKKSKSTDTSSRLDPPRPNFNCPECDFGSKTLIYMQMHISEKHLGVRRGSVPIESTSSEFIPSSRSLESDLQSKMSVDMQMPIWEKRLGIYKAPVSVENGSTISSKVFESPSIKNDENVSKSEQNESFTIQPKLKPLFKCTKCSFLTSLRIQLKVHVRKHHSKPQDPTKDGLECSTTTYKCFRCPFSSDSHIKYLFHKCSRKSVMKEDLECNYCSYVGSSRFTLMQHKKTHEKNLPIHQCPRCSFRSTIFVLKRHMSASGHDLPSGKEIEESSIITPKKSRKIFRCKKCSYSTTRNSSYINHARVHTQIHKNGYKCELCSFICTEFTSLKKHKFTHQFQQPIIQCQYCSFRSTPSAFRRHVLNSGHSSATSESNSKKTPEIIVESLSDFEGFN